MFKKMSIFHLVRCSNYYHRQAYPPFKIQVSSVWGKMWVILVTTFFLVYDRGKIENMLMKM